MRCAPRATARPEELGKWRRFGPLVMYPGLSLQPWEGWDRSLLSHHLASSPKIKEPDGLLGGP